LSGVYVPPPCLYTGGYDARKARISHDDSPTATPHAGHVLRGGWSGPVHGRLPPLRAVSKGGALAPSERRGGAGRALGGCGGGRDSGPRSPRRPLKGGAERERPLKGATVEGGTAHRPDRFRRATVPRRPEERRRRDSGAGARARRIPARARVGGWGNNVQKSILCQAVTRGVFTVFWRRVARFFFLERNLFFFILRLQALYNAA